MVGDGACGKSYLLLTYVNGCCPTKYIPTVFENYTARIMVNKVPIDLGLWDTSGLLIVCHDVITQESIFKSDACTFNH